MESPREKKEHYTVCRERLCTRISLVDCQRSSRTVYRSLNTHCTLHKKLEKLQQNSSTMEKKQNNFIYLLIINYILLILIFF